MAKKKALHDNTFPGETKEYRRARNSLLEAEMALRKQIEAVAAQRRGLPLGGEVPTDYNFEAWAPGSEGPKSVRLSDLFAPGKDTLFMYNFMYPENLNPKVTPCPSCTSIIDAIDGAAQHIADRVNLAVVAKVPIAAFHEHAERRGWRHVLLLSSATNTFKHDYHAEGPDEGQWPIASVFVRRGSKIHHFWSSELFYAPPDPGQDMRHVDFMWPMWSVFDTTPEGRGNWDGPKLDYSKAAHTHD